MLWLIIRDCVSVVCYLSRLFCCASDAHYASALSAFLGAALFMRSAYPYSLGSVRADLVRRATFICASDCPQATALLP